MTANERGPLQIYSLYGIVSVASYFSDEGRRCIRRGVQVQRRVSPKIFSYSKCRIERKLPKNLAKFLKDRPRHIQSHWSSTGYVIHCIFNN